MRRKIFLVGLLFLSTLIFGEEIFLKENKFFTRDKNNQEVLYSGKEKIDKKDFYGERVYKDGILIEEKIYNKGGALYTDFQYDILNKKGILRQYYKNGASLLYIFDKAGLKLTQKFKNGVVAKELHIKKTNFDTEKVANTQNWKISIADFPKIYYEEKIYDSKGNLLEYKINNNKITTYIKNGKKEISTYSNNYKSLKYEVYLDDGTLLTRSFGKNKNGSSSYIYTKTENYSNDGTLSEVYSLIDGDFIKIYADNPYERKINYKDGILISEDLEGKISKYRGPEKDYKNILLSQSRNFEEKWTREYPEVRVETWLFGILFNKNLEDENYLEFLDDFMKIKKIKKEGKERWYYPNYKLKTYAEDYTIKRRYDESGKVVYDIDKNINDKEYLKLSNSGKNYKVYFPNGKLAYKKEKKIIKEEFLKQFDDSYIEEIFYDKKGNEIYYCEDYRNQPQKLSNPGDEQSRFKPKNFLIRKIKRYSETGKLIYNEDFKIENDKFIFIVNSYDEKTSAPLYKMEKIFSIGKRDLSFEKYSLKIFKDGKLLSEYEIKNHEASEKYYFPTGQLKAQYEYKNKKEKYRVFYYSNGNKRYESFDSKEIRYFLNGKIEKIITFNKRFGKEIITYKNYSPSGNFLTEGEIVYKGKEMITRKIKEFFSNGAVKEIYEYSQVDGVEKTKRYSPDGLLINDIELKVTCINNVQEVTSEKRKFYDNGILIEEIIEENGKIEHIYYNYFGEKTNVGEEI